MKKGDGASLPIALRRTSSRRNFSPTPSSNRETERLFRINLVRRRRSYHIAFEASKMKTLSYQHRFPTRTQAVFFSLLVCALFTLCRPLESLATVRVASVFADNMVLQQNAKIPIWGWASPKETVQVELNGIRQSAPTNEHGVWRVELPPMTAGGPYELIVRGDNKIVFKDVYLGEVWLCAGQSNVTFPLKRAEDSQKEISTSTYPQLRFLTIPPKSEATPLNDFVAKWEVCSPKTSPSVSAIAYFFGQ